MLPIRTSLKNLASFVNFSKNLETKNPETHFGGLKICDSSKIMLKKKNVGQKHTQFWDPIGLEFLLKKHWNQTFKYLKITFEIKSKVLSN